MKEELEMEVKRQKERATRAEEALAGGEAAEMAEKLARAQEAVQMTKQVRIVAYCYGARTTCARGSRD